jgi:fatty acid synthase, animal type
MIFFHKLLPLLIFEMKSSVCGVVPSPHGSIIVCNRSKVSRIPYGMNMESAAAGVGRALFVASVVRKVISFSSSSKPRILLHAGKCTPAAISTCSFLKFQSIEFILTVSEHSSSLIPPTSLPSLTFVSEKFDVWSFHARQWATKGVDVAFDFSEDPNVTDVTMGVLSARGIFVRIGGEQCFRVQSGQQMILVDYENIVENDVGLGDVLDNLAPGLLSALTPSIELYHFHQLSIARAKLSSSQSDISVILDLRHIDATLQVLRGGIIKGTPAFNPRASYVIVGGIGGLGASIARFLVENGARHIVLTSRSGEAVRRSLPRFMHF